MTDVSDTTQKGPPSMLIADDDPDILRMLRERCTKIGFKVETANNGMQLLIKARQNKPDILIVDVNMPKLDGLSVCAHLLEPGVKPVDVILVTGSPNPDTPDRCESLGLFFARKGPDFWKTIQSALIRIRPDMAGIIEEQELKPRDANVHQRPRVLVVDDDPAIHTFLESRLGKLGIDTLFASNALQGYRIACRAHPSVIIVDNIMPDGDAQYLICRLRSNLSTENIPVLVISGQALDVIAEQRLKREISGHPGAAKVFRKSFDTEELFGALQDYCSFEKRPPSNTRLPVFIK